MSTDAQVAPATDPAADVADALLVDVGRPADVDEALATTRDSVNVAVWTAVSRATGLARVMVVTAVLGPTFLGNTYQFTNSVPNLVYYGLLGGSLVSSLLVPALVRHLAAARPAEAAALARKLFGCALGAAAIAVPVIIVGVPAVLRATAGAGAAETRAQVDAATWLVVLLSPQIICYVVIACSVAVMNASRRFALAAAAPLIENVGSIVVLVLVWVWFGSGREVTDVGTGEIALLGVGTTAAVVVHAAVQWLGARRSGVTLVPQIGWHDSEVRAVTKRGAAAVAQAGLWAIQLIVAMALANRLPGGVVAVLVATNFFFLPIALGATPIALSVLPRLAAHHAADRSGAWDDATARALSLTIFVTAPAAVGYLVLAPGLARVVTFGSAANAEAREMVTLALAALALGVIGTAAFTVATYASYARDRAWPPLRSMLVQSIVAVSIMLSSLAVAGDRALLLVTGGLAGGALVGAVLLLLRLRLSPRRRRRVARSAQRTGVAVLVMAPAAWSCNHIVAGQLPSRAGQTAALALSVVVGATAYVLAQRIARSPELALIAGSIPWRRGRAAARTAAISS